MSIRYPNSEHLPDSLLRDLMEEAETVTVPKTSSVDFIKKTLVGRNAETKRVIELSSGDIEDMTGIPNDEMFGTEKGGEKVAYIGAPWQGKTVMDSKRFFVFDYEYGEIANFTRTFSDLLDQLYTTFYGEYSFGLSDYANLLDSTDEIICNGEMEWAQTAFSLSNEILEDVKKLTNTENSEDLALTIKKVKDTAFRLQEMLALREEASADLILSRETERVETKGEHGIHHPIEGIHRFCNYITNTINKGLEDIKDYKETVKSHMDAFISELDEDMPGEDRETKIKQEELSILNSLRLHKQTENSEVIAGIFPNLPLKSQSMDRIVCSYSISTHVIPDADKVDFESWLGEIQRVLKPGGKAYIFPMQQGFPFGRTYDDEALQKAMETFNIKSGGKLAYDFFENPNKDAWRQDTTLVITKSSK